MKDVECEDGEGDIAKGVGECQEGDNTKRRGGRQQMEGGGEKKQVPERHATVDDEEMDTRDGKRLQKKRKMKERGELNAESKCLEVSK